MTRTHHTHGTRPGLEANGSGAPVRLLHAENILDGHPDRLCDAVAEAIVTRANTADAEALVGVEVALHRRRMFITGRVAATATHPDGFDDDALEQLANSQLEAAGYTGAWAHPISVTTDLEIGPLEEDERGIRRYSDDQGIAVGHADPATPTLLPVEAHLARVVRDMLQRESRNRPDALGPDGKVLIRIERSGSRFRLDHVNISIQHAPGLDFAPLHRLLLEPLEETLETARDSIGRSLTGASIELPARLDGESVRINGIGDFTCGGPLGDNGLSGKKLVVDHYGPHIPIGGGAICGKDVHKPDRIAALRSRQLAIRLARRYGQAATVQTGFLPGLEAPDRLSAHLHDGTHLTGEQIASAITVPDLTLAGSARDLELAAVDWPGQMRRGYFGTGAAWER